MTNTSHDQSLKSWVESANDPNIDFPIQNLPLGIFTRPEDHHTEYRAGIAIGDMILDLFECSKAGLLPIDDSFEIFMTENLNLLMEEIKPHSMDFRMHIQNLLLEGNDEIHQYEKAHTKALRLLVPMTQAEMMLPAAIGDFTDFYASIYHATNVGRLFRPDNPLLPNYKWVPIGYHGRSSSIVMSGTHIKRPKGQSKTDKDEIPVFGASKVLDYELEVGCFIANSNEQGEPINIDHAEDYILGFCIVNDWSARDIQAWEYQPLGPFLSKNFATSISPWIVTTEALAPFRTHAFTRGGDDPEPLPYLESNKNERFGGLDIKLEAYLSTKKMREENTPPHLLSSGNTKDLYWTFAQMLTHHTSNGCNVQSGDLIASGTVSGATKDSLGCLLEMTKRGAESIELPNGETRKFLEDYDEVIFRAYCERDGFRRIGFGECRGMIVPSNL